LVVEQLKSEADKAAIRRRHDRSKNPWVEQPKGWWLKVNAHLSLA
jgi:hypothetical protein